MNTTYERVNITLPSRTLERLDKVAGYGKRSHLIDIAVNEYLKTNTITRLKEGYTVNRVRDRALAAEWALLGDA